MGVENPASSDFNQPMSNKHVISFDLNLIKVFLAIWDLRSLTAAGDRLGLTQPAVSHALKRLRDQFSDPLFTRAGNEMSPTDAAMRLYSSFEAALQLVSQTVRQSAEFTPGTSRRVFRLGMSDVSEFCYLPQILQSVEAVAPSVRIESTEVDLETIDMKMKSGQIDIALGYLPGLNDCDETVLVEDEFVCLVRKDHPFSGEALSLADLSGLTYVDCPRGTGYRMIEHQLDLLGVRRQVNARLAHLSVVPEIVRRTNMAALYPRAATEILNTDRKFRILELPADLHRVPVKLYTHRKFAADRGILWLSEVIKHGAHEAE